MCDKSCFRSGTVRVEEVDDFFQLPGLNARGEIGINIYQPPEKLTSADYCKRWVNKQTRQNCSLPCAPTFRKAEIVVLNGFCFTNESLSKICITGGCRNNDEKGLVECCYKKKSGRKERLIRRAEKGAGRSLPHEAWTNNSVRIEEDNAFRNCCSINDATSCDLFHSVRPICTNDGWKDYDNWGKIMLLFGSRITTCKFLNQSRPSLFGLPPPGINVVIIEVKLGCLRVSDWIW